MMALAPARARTIAAVISLTALVGAYLYGGQPGLIGMSLGLGATGFTVWILWMMIRLATSSAEDTRTHKVGIVLIVLAFFLKLPVYVGAAMLTNAIGGAATGCFLTGLGLVYSCLVGWALAQG